MEILLCKACNGTLEHLSGNLFICPYCRTKQILAISNEGNEDPGPRKGQESTYQKACSILSMAKTEEECLEAAALFRTILPYKDCSRLHEECASLASLYRNERMYAEAIRLIDEGTPHFLQQAIDILSLIPDWKDAGERIEECQRKIDDLERQIRAHNLIVEARNEAQRKRDNLLILLVSALLAIGFVIFSLSLIWN